MTDFFTQTELLTPPAKRAAFSDRTAYLMAEMSRLAYFRFEGGSNIKELLAKTEEFVLNKDHSAELTALIKNTVVTNSAEDAKNVLDEILTITGFELLQTFNNTSTGVQAFLCRNPAQNIAILAFRGTEMNLKDIKTDVNASLTRVVYGKNEEKSVSMHSGYYQQYSSIKDDLEQALANEQLNADQLFITGHSLGGALAITATKFLSNDSSGACYTFGSPPVGTKRFDEDIKTPIYRVINYVDIVPRLPNPYLIGSLTVLGWLMELILSPIGNIFSRIKDTGMYKHIEKLLIDAGQYRQSGYESYLVGTSSDVKLRYNVMFYDKAIWWLLQFRNIFSSEILSDHKIEQYSEKLATWAQNRAK